MYKICTFKDYKTKTLTINSINKLKKVVNGQEINFLAVKLMNVFEIKYLRINFAN